MMSAIGFAFARHRFHVEVQLAMGRADELCHWIADGRGEHEIPFRRAERLQRDRHAELSAQAGIAACSTSAA